jgi:hypothetical protein
MPSLGYLPLHDPGEANLFLKPWMDSDNFGLSLASDLAPSVSLFGGHWILSFLHSGICRLSQALILAS